MAETGGGVLEIARRRPRFAAFVATRSGAG
jgi:hypothetical protein